MFYYEVGTDTLPQTKQLAGRLLTKMTYHRKCLYCSSFLQREAAMCQPTTVMPANRQHGTDISNSLFFPCLSFPIDIQPGVWNSPRSVGEFSTTTAEIQLQKQKSLTRSDIHGRRLLGRRLILATKESRGETKTRLRLTFVPSLLFWPGRPICPSSP